MVGGMWEDRVVFEGIFEIDQLIPPPHSVKEAKDKAFQKLQ